MKLRSPIISDLEAIYTWENDTCVQSFTATPRNYTREEITEFIHRNDNLVEARQQRLMIVDDLNQPIGCVDMYDFDEGERSAFVGILVYENQRAGIGHKALEQLQQYARNVYYLRELLAVIPPTNEAAKRLFEKSGYKNIHNNIYSLKF